MTSKCTPTTTTPYVGIALVYELCDDVILAKCAESAAERFSDANEQLVALAVNMTAKLDRVVAAVQEGRHVNSLGELQGSASDFDRLCALRERAAEDVRHLAALARRQYTNEVADAILALVQS